MAKGFECAFRCSVSRCQNMQDDELLAQVSVCACRKPYRSWLCRDQQGKPGQPCRCMQAGGDVVGRVETRLGGGGTRGVLLLYIRITVYSVHLRGNTFLHYVIRTSYHLVGPSRRTPIHRHLFLRLAAWFGCVARP